MKQKILQVVFAMLVCAGAQAQVNSGSNGSDGAFNPATNTVINMADHPNGIYQYASVTISNGVSVSFIPNANNTPVTWLVQGNCEIDGTVDVSGQPGSDNGLGGSGGPGGYRGGIGGTTPAPPGQGPGGGIWGSYGGNANYNYGNNFLVPLLGGSGGGGGYNSAGGGGGGGAILIAASGQILLYGQILANGGAGVAEYRNPGPNAVGGGGSGGAVRIVTSKIVGSGSISTAGGSSYYNNGAGGSGRVQFDTFENDFGDSINGVFTQGYQSIIIPVAGQGVQLSIASVAGAAVSATPNGQIVTPDAIISGQQANPIPIVVSCANLPLNTPVTVTVKPASGASVSVVGYNTTGTLASSTATVSLTMPRGGGIIYATAATSN